MRIVFVVLHYLAEKDTVECIESIKANVQYDNKFIVIVDNASTNDSFGHITGKFGDDNEISLIRNKVNLGFARGNNEGYRYAKNVLKADFIIMLNNDTIIKQASFGTKIIEKYNESKFYVLGPDIVTKDGYHQNPLKHRVWTVNKLKLFKLKAQLRLIDRKLLAFGPKILRKKKEISALSDTLQADHFNIRLHGACLIFSPDYIKQFNGLDDGTFLYMEEDLLQMQMDYLHLPMLYTSELEIFHKEDAATNMVSGNTKERDIRFLKNLINSIDVCIDRAQKMRKG
ncbi:glycosyltransferase family 2 protein [Lacrimispora celerecrescens]|uniref:Glycosyltransferase 2-like domain-containing protein n=1 Tax=Lacrimispora celerecrescens TaxID=29354 RepID=A0A084JQG5_9FIRM|nr:glycosyltransferase [Lacrimispora celerecrescens]KEZ91199.1 hypothetical protein IO98_03880 [Lacrimispora celerecrescens]